MTFNQNIRQIEDTTVAASQRLGSLEIEPPLTRSVLHSNVREGILRRPQASDIYRFLHESREIRGR